MGARGARRRLRRLRRPVTSTSCVTCMLRAARGIGTRPSLPSIGAMSMSFDSWTSKAVRVVRNSPGLQPQRGMCTSSVTTMSEDSWETLFFWPKMRRKVATFDACSCYMKPDAPGMRQSLARRLSGPVLNAFAGSMITAVPGTHRRSQVPPRAATKTWCATCSKTAAPNEVEGLAKHFPRPSGCEVTR